jgi:asparagine synthase (glutamine-hydrolysing)
VLVDGPAGLAHRRLAIIDPEGGAQPLTTDDGSLALVFNGEIYNFREVRRELEAKGRRFRTDCDTEVVLQSYAEWKEECLGRLRGMFAFGIWDRAAGRLFLARDRLGIKPLVYLTTRDYFAFASELQAFDSLEWDRSLDLEALDLYLHFQYIPAPYSIYRLARKLPPAHYMVVDQRGPRPPVRYWRLEMRPNHRLSEDEWLERVDAGVSDAVRSHLVSDVPFGAFLSGGVDSSTVVAYMTRHMQVPVRTFSISFDDPRYDESGFARMVADRLGTEHRQETVRPDAVAVLPKLVRHYGEPFADSSALPTYYVSQLASGAVKMVLSGDGGDENFAGYPSYQVVAWEHRLPTGAVRKARFAIGSLLRSAGLRPPIRRAEDVWFESVAYFGLELRRRLWRPEHHPIFEASRLWFDAQTRRAPTTDVCSRFQHVDLHTYLPYDILAKVDIASMCHGLEVRVPLLDHRLVELVAEIPASLKLRQTAGPDGVAFEAKHLLKQLARRQVPAEAIDRRKMGFSIPISEWFRDSLAPRLAHIASPESQLSELLEPHALQSLVEGHLAGEDHGWRLWSLVVLDEWLEQASQRRSSVSAACL